MNQVEDFRDFMLKYQDLPSIVRYSGTPKGGIDRPLNLLGSLTQAMMISRLVSLVPYCLIIHHPSSMIVPHIIICMAAVTFKAKATGRLGSKWPIF